MATVLIPYIETMIVMLSLIFFKNCVCENALEELIVLNRSIKIVACSIDVTCSYISISGACQVTLRVSEQFAVT